MTSRLAIAIYAVLFLGGLAAIPVGIGLIYVPGGVIAAGVVLAGLGAALLSDAGEVVAPPEAGDE